MDFRGMSAYNTCVRWVCPVCKRIVTGAYADLQLSMGVWKKDVGEENHTKILSSGTNDLLNHVDCIPKTTNVTELVKFVCSNGHGSVDMEIMTTEK